MNTASQLLMDIMKLNGQKTAKFQVKVDLILYIRDHRLVVDEILFDTTTCELTIMGEKYGQYTINLSSITSPLSYEFQ